MLLQYVVSNFKSIGSPELSDYDVEKIKTAICGAEALHINKEDACPEYFVTTVYILLNKIMDMLPPDN